MGVKERFRDFGDRRSEQQYHGRIRTVILLWKGCTSACIQDKRKLWFLSKNVRNEQARTQDEANSQNTNCVAVRSICLDCLERELFGLYEEIL